ncbi:signal peptide protein [Clostridium perfringens]|nr:signal peptide protein [Clostridium perfringens]
MENSKMRNIIALALAIGVTGSVGSLAYFSDKEKMNGEIKLTLGTLSSEITKGIKIEGIDIEVPVSDTFLITNNGTLDQTVLINFENSSIGNDGLEKIKYSLSFKSSKDRKLKSYGNGEETLLSLFENGVKVVDLDNNEIILEEGEILTATLILNMQRDMPEKYSGTDFNFDLRVGYNQANTK